MEVFIIIVASTLILGYKSIFLKLSLTLYLYPILVILLLIKGIHLPGIIGIVGEPKYGDLLGTAFWWSTSGYFLLVGLTWSLRHKLAQFRAVKAGELTRFILLIFLVFVAAISWPKAFFLADHRFNLFPFFAWGALYTILSVLMIITSRSIWSLTSILHIILLLFIMVRGERADQIMVLFVLILMHGGKVKFERELSFRLVILSVFAFLGMTIIGIVRVVGFDAFAKYYAHYLGLSFYAQQTALDVTHVYLSSVWYFFNEPKNWMTFLNTPASFFPGLPGGGTTSSINYIQVLDDVIPNAGGGLFYSEAVLNLGFLGVLIYSFILGIIIRFSFNRSGYLPSLLLIVNYVLIFRVQWYGLLYALKPLFLTLVLLYFLIHITNRLKDKHSANESSNCT